MKALRLQETFQPGRRGSIELYGREGRGGVTTSKDCEGGGRGVGRAERCCERGLLMNKTHSIATKICSQAPSLPNELK